MTHSQRVAAAVRNFRTTYRIGRNRIGDTTPRCAARVRRRRKKRSTKPK